MACPSLAISSSIKSSTLARSFISPFSVCVYLSPGRSLCCVRDSSSKTNSNAFAERELGTLPEGELGTQIYLGLTLSFLSDKVAKGVSSDLNVSITILGELSPILKFALPLSTGDRGQSIL